MKASFSVDLGLLLSLTAAGSGYVAKVGCKVTVAEVGDPVGMSFSSCSSCKQCEAGHLSYCKSFNALNIVGIRETFEQTEGRIAGKFFGQSSFANYTIANESSLVNLSGIVKSEEELRMLGPFGCGFQTGAGTIANLAGAGPEDTVAVIGLGGVGLAGVMVSSGCWN